MCVAVIEKYAPVYRTGPRLRFPPLKIATPDRANSTIVRAIRRRQPLRTQCALSPRFRLMLQIRNDEIDFRIAQRSRIKSRHLAIWPVPHRARVPDVALERTCREIFSGTHRQIEIWAHQLRRRQPACDTRGSGRRRGLGPHVERLLRTARMMPRVVASERREREPRR